MKLLRTTIGLVTGILGCIFSITYPAAAQESNYIIQTRNGNTEQQATTPTDVQANNLYYDAVKANILGNEKQAENLYLQFIKIKPDVAAAYFELCKLSVKQKNEAQALQYIQKAIALDNTNKWYKSLYGDLLAGNNRYEDAAKIFDELAKTEQYNDDYLLRAALFYEHADKFKESLNALDRLIQQSGQDEELLLQKEHIYARMNDVDNAEKVAEQLIEQNPKEGKYYVLLAELYENNGPAEKVMDVYKRAQQTIPNDPAIQLGLADHFRKNKDTAQYEEYVKKTILNKELDAESQLSLLVPYLQNLGNDSQRKKEGLSLTAQLVSQHQNDAEVLAIYGDVLAINDETGKAVEEYKKSLSIDPSKFSVWQQLLYSYTDKENADSLIKYGQKALKLFPNQAMAHYLYGIGEMNKKDYAEAVKSINRAIDLQPDGNPKLLGQMYSLLGDVYNTMKEYSLSDSAFEKALDLDPDNATTLNNYSYYLSERGTQLSEAERLSKRSLELRSDEPTFLDTYGWILYKSGKYEKAKEYIQKAIDLNPANTDATVYEHLGDIYYKLNDKDRAIEYWQKAKQKGSEDPQIDKKIQERKLYE